MTTSAGNNEATFLLNATHVVQMQPLYRCTPGSPLLARWHPEWINDATGLHVTDLRGEGALGAHGGTGLSAIGGTIRRGELNATAPPIRHALKLELNARRFYFCADFTKRETCFRWPAITADSYAVKKDDPGSRYNGTNPDLQPGSLLAMSSDDAALVRPKLKTEVARRMLGALVGFGAYIVDDAAGNYDPRGKTNICYETGVEAEVAEQYDGLALTASPGHPLFDDFTAIVQSLSAVTNNGPNAVGGGGAPVAERPLPLCALSV